MEERRNKKLFCMVTSIAKRLVSNKFSVHFQVHLTAEHKQSEYLLYYQNEITSLK